ncbi:(Fe-S)-binding protein [Magnetospira sp. QH-2]|uniref:(Fe-S)-binding protein n=1 Tax=Magnetospira sp. (strain QH-2) TaxID=1288970 RepID=UPI0003E80E47|nr:(Fe-S)-binding protein [Magnetospira sp. QH-2]CCQ74541.1 putative Fe-S oxidoreductase [Magnetospira sp. QH-2]
MTRPYPETPPSEVYFFATCLVDLFYPEAGLAGVKLLRREGIKIDFPQDQSCCGQPAFNNGFMDDARKVAAAQLALFPENKPVVVPSGSCAGMIRKHYPELFEGTPLEAAARDLSERVYELTEFLVHVLKVQYEDLGEPTKITWHGSCHSVREMGITDEPKILLNGLGNVTLEPLQRERECCGFGGTFAIKMPEVSAAMVTDKVADIDATGAEAVVSGDCGCLMNITGAQAKSKARAKGRHIAQFLWERIHGRD